MNTMRQEGTDAAKEDSDGAAPSRPQEEGTGPGRRDHAVARRGRVSPLPRSSTPLLGADLSVLLAIASNGTLIVPIGMALLAVGSALALAEAFGRALTSRDLDLIQMEYRTTPSGIRETVAPASLRPFLRPYPALFCALVPSLAFGLLATAAAVPVP